MNSDRVVLTRAGAERLRGELSKLKKVDRPAVIVAIAEARSHGDLSENAEYDAAREQQGFIEARIADLEASLSIAEVIDPTTFGVEGKVVFGATVELYDALNDGEVTYQLVGNLEANIDEGRISISSPIGKAMIGKRVGDEFDVDTPGGRRTYEVLDVSYG